MEWKYEQYTILKVSSDKRGLIILNAKPAELSLDVIINRDYKLLEHLLYSSPNMDLGEGVDTPSISCGHQYWYKVF